MTNTFIYLIGFPATGKYTIAKQLCALESNMKLVDNHLINNPVFGVLDLDGKTKIHADIWGYLAQIWDVVAETIVKHSSEKSSFVFTNVLLKDDPADAVQYNRIKNIAEKRGGKFIPVLLTCSKEQLMDRIGNEDRKARFKMLDQEGLSTYIDEHKLINIQHENLITLDTSNCKPDQIAKQILEDAI